MNQTRFMTHKLSKSQHNTCNLCKLPKETLKLRHEHLELNQISVKLHVQRTHTSSINQGTVKHCTEEYSHP